jgi:cell division protein ZipA
MQTTVHANRFSFLMLCGLLIGCGGSQNADHPVVGKDGQNRIVVGDLELTPASENHRRAALLGTEGSEDARHILGMIDLPARAISEDEKDYLPEPAVSWVLDIRFPGDPQLDPEAVSALFDTAWRKKFGSPSDYGRDVAGHWSYLICADCPKVVDQLKMAFDYVDPLHDDAPLPTEAQYAQRLAEVQERMKHFGKATVTASLPPAEAAVRSQQLRQLKQQLNLEAGLVLRAPSGKRFEGKAIWDVMLCLGLEWGDMDCFHWRNASESGGDSLFSVETTTSPGYFLPEQVAAGRVQTDDLVFVFSVPRCAKPVEVFDAMSRAVTYSQSRLGGAIVDRQGQAADVAAQRKRIVETVEKLKAAGLEPGASGTLQLF